MLPKKTCELCHATFEKKPKETWAGWNKRRGCSMSCARRLSVVRIPIQERILAKVTASEDGCWIWSGATTPKGKYGVIGIGEGSRMLTLTHRAMYELSAEIPAGYEIDHLCRITLCCNPQHLEAVTKAENLRRQQAAITHCIRGHELTADNVYNPPSTPTKRQCRKCIKIRSAEATERYRARSRSLAASASLK